MTLLAGSLARCLIPLWFPFIQGGNDALAHQERKKDPKSTSLEAGLDPVVTDPCSIHACRVKV